MDDHPSTRLFSEVKKKHPLVHHLTNVVTINDCANVTLAIGASPVMASSPEEVEEMGQHADALVINFGTMNEQMFAAMVHAGRAANKNRIPVVFDPVGVGATRYRTKKALQFLQQVLVAVICGNRSEIHALNGGQATTRGVDAGEVSISLTRLANDVAKQFSCVTVISGRQDIIADGSTVVKIGNGDDWLTKITGTGCMATSLIGCFTGVTEDYFSAAVAGMSVMGLAGERAKKHLLETEGIGSYKIKLLDHIFLIDANRWKKEAQIIET